MALTHRTVNRTKCRTDRIIALVAMMTLAFLVSSCAEQTENAAPSPDIPSSGELDLAYSPQDESVAVATLTAVVVESYTDYDVTMIRAKTPQEAVAGVREGEFDAYQNLWSPGQDALLDAGGINRLKPWIAGTTRASLATPSYLGIRDADEIEGTGAERAFVLEPGAFALGKIPEDVFGEHGLTPEYYPSMAALWDEAGPLYEREEPFVVFAYAPNWTNLRYQLDYLEGAEELFEFNEPHEILAIGRRGLGDDDPLVYAMLDDLLLTETQLASLELEIVEADSPRAGAVAWAEENRNLMAYWVYAARQRAAE